MIYFNISALYSCPGFRSKLLFKICFKTNALQFSIIEDRTTFAMGVSLGLSVFDQARKLCHFFTDV